MSKTQIAIRITSQAIANQLQSLAHSHGVRKIDKAFKPVIKIDPNGWDTYDHVEVDVPFKVGAIAVFWLYPTNVHYNQCCQDALMGTLVGIPTEHYGTANELSLLLQELKV